MAMKIGNFRPLATMITLPVLVLGGCSAAPPLGSQPQANTYVGSGACRDCHQSIYDRWKETNMANVVQDPKQHPSAILGDFSTPNPLVTFAPSDVDFTYGSRWKQRYFKKKGDDYVVLPAQWDVRARVWRPYYARPGTDWWVAFYPPEQDARPTGPLCDGCHSVNYNITTHTVTEWNVGCERCHGPGGAHAQDPKRVPILNLARLDDVRSNDVCIQCHSQGQPRQNPHEGRYYDWPVGFTSGGRLADVWDLEEHRLGETTFTHWPDGSAHKNRMQGNDFVTSRMYAKGVRCYACHDPHGSEQPADLVLPGNAVCMQCHGPQLQAGPPGSLEQHSHHRPESTGSSCIACHMPEIADTIANVRVRSHTFRFISPAMTDKYGIPNPCTSCHEDQSTAWARKAMDDWTNVSPWRMAQ
jgi:predicted CXXCH cytochrome family protein